jgi:tetratricopeptide (TPR) repeat protein
MNGIIAIASTAALLVSVPVNAQTTTSAPSAVEQELIALDKKFDEARRKGDMSFVSDVLTDDFVQVTATGVRTKAELMKALASAKPVAPGADVAPTPTYAVRVHGDTAVMTHVTSITDPHAPAPGNAVMHVFVKQQGRWKMAGWSSTLANPSTEQSINRAGYELMESGKTKEAIDLFKLNVQLHPESWNAYDSLGEAYAGMGDKALAIQNYEKSIQLNPKNDLGKAALAKLKGQ